MRRKKEEALFLGVVSAVSGEFGIDPTISRVIFAVLLAISPLAMSILYFLLALLIPTEDSPEELSDRVFSLLDEIAKWLEGALNPKDKRFLGGFLLLIGFCLLLANWLPPGIIPFGTRTGGLVMMLLAVILPASKGERQNEALGSG